MPSLSNSFTSSSSSSPSVPEESISMFDLEVKRDVSCFTLIVCLNDDCVVLVEMLEANPGGWRCHCVQLQTSGPVHPQSTLSPG